MSLSVQQLTPPPPLITLHGLVLLYTVYMCSIIYYHCDSGLGFQYLKVSLFYVYVCATLHNNNHVLQDVRTPLFY